METQTKALTPREVEERLANEASPLMRILKEKINEQLKNAVAKRNSVEVDICSMLNPNTGYDKNARILLLTELLHPVNWYAIDEVMKSYEESGWNIRNNGDRRYTLTIKQEQKVEK
jgi:hypothetical protein